jgi:hypothetical protein
MKHVILISGGSDALEPSVVAKAIAFVVNMDENVAIPELGIKTIGG